MVDKSSPSHKFMEICYSRKYNGYCSGVKRAIDLAFSATATGQVYCYGELVHNARVTDAVTSRGIRVVCDTTCLKEGDTLIICAHGVSKCIYTQCQNKQVNIVDATCPHVAKIQRDVHRHYLDGYQILLFGDQTHAEIIGVNGWCDNTAIICDSPDNIDLTQYEKVFVVFQTTFDSQKALKNKEILASMGVKTLVISDTICYTTLDRQSRILYLSNMSDLVVVVGDKTSNNTKRLADIARRHSCEVILTEGEDFATDICSYNKISIIAGASTPTELSEEVLLRMVEQAKDNNQTVVVNEEFAAAVNKIPAKRSYKKGQKVKGHVIQIDEEGIRVNLSNTKGDGFIPNEELTVEGDWQEYKSTLRVGDMIEGIVISTDKTITLSKKEIDILYKDDELIPAIKDGGVFELTMTKAVKGGLLSKLGSYTVFVPASHIRDGFVRNLDQYVGKKLRLVVLEDGIDESKKKIVASQRELITKEKQAKEDNFWNNIEVDEIVEGKVLRFASFGAFVNVRGFDCLAHLSDLSWSNTKDPSEILEIGKTYEFVVLKLDREKKRASIGYKQLQPHPWVLAAEKFPVGSIVQGKVARILPFGAFVELDKGIDGLLHISNVSWDWLGDINQVLKVGDIIDVMVIEFDTETKRITLSKKATMERPEKPIEQEDAQEDMAN